ncbi:DNA-binding protein [Klebsiella quasipneumoniae]
MRPATFEPAVIIEAGLALQAEGRKITGFALRRRIGGGNPARLRQIWEEYQASQAQVNAEPVAELPVEVAEEVKLVTQALAERISQLVTELNDKAVRAAERRVAEITRAAGEQMAQAESELADAAQTVEDLETRFDDLQDEHRRTEELLTRSRSSEQAQAVELAQLNERLSALSRQLADTEKAATEAAEQHRRQQADWQQRLEEAGQQLTAATARHEAETQGLVQRHEKESSELTARYEQQLAVADRHHQESASRHTEELRTLNDQHQQRVSELSQQLQSAEQALLTQTKKHDAALLSLGQKHDAETGRLEKSRDTAVREAQTAREEKAALAGELQALRAQNNQLTALLAGKKAP